MPVAVYPPCSRSSLGCSSAVQRTRLARSWAQQCWATAHCRTLAARLLPWPGFSFPHPAAPVWELLLNCSHESHSPDLSPSLMVWALALEKGDRGFSSHLVLERLRLVAPKGTPAGTGWEHPQPFQCGHVGGSSRVAGIRDWTREFGLAASAQGCWRRLLGADHCCNC